MRTLKILAAAALAAGISTASMAQTPEPAVWQGDLFITVPVVSAAACTGFVSTGDFDEAVYRPNIGTPPANQAKEALLIVTSRSAFIIEATGNTLRAKSAKAAVGAFGSHATVDTAATTVENLKTNPAKITATTQVVQIVSGTISWFNIPGCNVEISGALGLRPPG